MKRFAIPTSLLLALCLSCGDSQVQASDITDAAKGAIEQGKDAVAKGVDAFKDLDLPSLDAEALKGKAGEMLSTLTSKLGEIKDKASAEKIAATLEPLTDMMSKAKDLLADNMPSMDSLKGAVENLKTKFSGDSGIMSALKPLMDKLNALIG